MQDRRSALVTGSTSGIGLVIASGLAARGMNIVLNGFGDAAEIETQRLKLQQAHGVEVLFHGADMSLQGAVEDLMAFGATHLGGIDVLVNNAGIQHVAPVDACPVEKWNAILPINLTAAFHTTRLALPHMKFNQWGRIVNIASAHALVAS
ncbi:MAG: SDR family NAD(P)-dependent oxidoreductase, partial [Burkholderiales bacterium]|nr:SDR family NAD(P)-dependent oxidoreductase [Burkholderiales bacterium]